MNAVDVVSKVINCCCSLVNLCLRKLMNRSMSLHGQTVLIEFKLVLLCLSKWVVSHCPHRKQFRRIGNCCS